MACVVLAALPFAAATSGSDHAARGRTDARCRSHDKGGCGSTWCTVEGVGVTVVNSSVIHLSPQADVNLKLILQELTPRLSDSVKLAKGSALDIPCA